MNVPVRAQDFVHVRLERFGARDIGIVQAGDQHIPVLDEREGGFLGQRAMVRAERSGWGRRRRPEASWECQQPAY